MTRHNSAHSDQPSGNHLCSITSLPKAKRYALSSSSLSYPSCSSPHLRVLCGLRVKPLPHALTHLNIQSAIPEDHSVSVVSFSAHYKNASHSRLSADRRRLAQIFFRVIVIHQLPPICANQTSEASIPDDNDSSDSPLRRRGAPCSGHGGDSAWGRVCSPSSRSSNSGVTMTRPDHIAFFTGASSTQEGRGSPVASW